MWLVIRLVFGILAIFVVATASPEQKGAMMSGAGAFASAAIDACTRYSHCNGAVAGAKGLAQATTERMSRLSSFDRGPALLER